MIRSNPHKDAELERATAPEVEDAEDRVDGLLRTEAGGVPAPTEWITQVRASVAVPPLTVAEDVCDWLGLPDFLCDIRKSFA